MGPSGLPRKAAHWLQGAGHVPDVMPSHRALGSDPAPAVREGPGPLPLHGSELTLSGWCTGRSQTYIKKAARGEHGGATCAPGLSLGAGRAWALSTRHADPSRERQVLPLGARSRGRCVGTRVRPPGDRAQWWACPCPGVPGEVGAKQGPPLVIGAEGGSGRRGPAWDPRGGKCCPWSKERRAGLSCRHRMWWGVRGISLATSRVAHPQGPRRSGEQGGPLWVQRGHQGRRVGHRSAGGTGLGRREATAGPGRRDEPAQRGAESGCALDSLGG